MMIVLCMLMSLCMAEKKTFADVYKGIMKDSNGRVTYDGESAVLVLFYKSADQNETKPSWGQPFIVPNDEMTKLKIDNFYELIQKQKGSDNSTSTELYCRLLVNYRYSDPIQVMKIEDDKDNSARLPRYVAAQVELNDDSRVESVVWDKGNCDACSKENCMSEFCTYLDSKYGDSNCATEYKDKNGKCGFIVYLGWKGPAHAGFTTQYLKSYRNLPSYYTKYSMGNQFTDAAGDEESNWISF